MSAIETFAAEFEAMKERLDRVEAQLAHATVEDRLLRIEEVASLTGEKPWAVYQLHRKGILPALENGRSKRWRESTVRTYIERAPKL